MSSLNLNLNLHQAMVASDESSSRSKEGQQQRALNTTQENIKGARSLRQPKRQGSAFVRAVLGQQLSDLREDFFYY